MPKAGSDPGLVSQILNWPLAEHVKQRRRIGASRQTADNNLLNITVYGDITFMVVNPSLLVRKLVSLPHGLVAAVEDYRFKNRIKTESEAIRRLIETGLAAVETVSASQLISFCRNKQRHDIAQIIESIVFELKNPSDLPLLHSFPLPPDCGTAGVTALSGIPQGRGDCYKCNGNGQTQSGTCPVCIGSGWQDGAPIEGENVKPRLDRPVRKRVATK
jgi:hypothetical protein